MAESDHSKRIQTLLKLYPWYGGLSSDLLFWIAINTLFLQITKGFTLPEIVNAKTVSTVASILLQVPIIKLVERIGNTKAVRIGSVTLLGTALLYTFGNTFWILVAANIMRDVALSLRGMVRVTLKHDLTLLDRDYEFVNYETKANMVYSTATMLISVIASVMFNLYHFFPMLCCIFTCSLCVVLSFSMVDYSETSPRQTQREEKKKVSVKLTGILLTALVLYSIIYAIIDSGQDNAKLFIQVEMLMDLTVENTSMLLGIIVLISRISRVLANAAYTRLYKKIGEKIGIVLSAFVVLAFALLLAGYGLKQALPLKIVLMGMGYAAVLFTRDPFRLFVNNLVLNHSAASEHQRIMMLLELARKIADALVSISASLVLTGAPMVIAMGLYMVYGLVGMGVSIYLYRMVANKEKASAISLEASI